MKIGIFGGSFNPPHLGHIQAAQAAQKNLGLHQVRIVVSGQSPLKAPIEGPEPKDRLELTKLAFSSWGSQFLVDDREVKRKGPSYTIDTLDELIKEFPKDEFFLIIGTDQFSQFDSWKSSSEILSKVNLVVISRPGTDFPESKEALPKSVRDLVVEQDFNFYELKTGKSVQYMRIKEIETSSTELRKWLRIGKNVEKYIPLSVEVFIKEKGLYRGPGEKVKDYRKFVEFCAHQLFSRKAIAVKAFDLSKIGTIADYTIIASGSSTRHATSLAENLARAVKEEYNLNPLSREGLQEGRWVVLDYGSAIVHIFYDFVRQEYAMEKIWSDGKEIPLVDPFNKDTK
jgi:nicotinate-nucleotide adenylyltransferase